MMDERDKLLELKHQHMSDVFEELKRIRTQLLYGDEPAYVRSEERRVGKECH